MEESNWTCWTSAFVRTTTTTTAAVPIFGPKIMCKMLPWRSGLYIPNLDKILSLYINKLYKPFELNKIHIAAPEPPNENCCLFVQEHWSLTIFGHSELKFNSIKRPFDHFLIKKWKKWGKLSRSRSRKIYNAWDDPDPGLDPVCTFWCFHMASATESVLSCCIRLL